jgi:DNA-binding transcriptional LysR family regulator
MNAIHDADHGAPEQLAAIDLNLLVAFDALARERNVTRAAGRVGVTQSAMSHSLARLRELLGDALLVRGAAGMTLTARAQALVVPLRSALVTLGRALAEPATFEPATARRTFSLASPDLFDVLAVPRLLERVRREAPAVDLTVMTVNDRRLSERLETGELDVAIVPEVEGARSERAVLTAGGLVRRTILRDGLVCLLRGDHPALGRARRAPRLSLEAYAAASHIVVSPSGAGPGPVDHALEQRGLHRRVALRIPAFYSALAISEASDLILTAPTSLARLVPAGSALVAVAPPLPLPEHGLQLMWHERFSSDPGQRWLREVLVEVAASLDVAAHRSRQPPRSPRARAARAG